MKYLLLLLAALLVVPSAFAQTSSNWTFDGDVGSAEMPTPSIHGLAVDPAGRLWYQSYYAQTRDSVAVDPAVVANSSGCSKTTNNCRVTAIHVLNTDGSEASFSPLSIVTLPGGEKDTLGGGVILNSTGQRVWDYNSGRGLATGPDGDVYAAVGSATVIYRFDYETGAVVDYVRPSNIESHGSAAPAVDEDGYVYFTGIFPGDPIQRYSPSLEFVENVDDADIGYTRGTGVLPDGFTVLDFKYSERATTIFQRTDEFEPYDSVGVAFKGMAVESWAMDPSTGYIWVSAGSPNDKPSAPWQQHTWYAFDVDDALTNEIPTPLDSIRWENPGDGRPRAIAFAPDGNTVYVGEFSLGSPALQRFVRTSVGTERPMIEGVELGQNRPNPFSGSTEISFSLSEAASVRLTVYDAVGRVVSVLTEGPKSAGTHTERFDAASLAAGVYSYVLEIDGQRATRRMLVVR